MALGRDEAVSQNREGGPGDIIGRDEAAPVHGGARPGVGQELEAGARAGAQEEGRVAAGGGHELDGVAGDGGVDVQEAGQMTVHIGGRIRRKRQRPEETINTINLLVCIACDLL